MNKKVTIPEELLAPELYSVVAVLKPQDTRGISAVQGYHIYAAFLNLLNASSPSFAEELHNLEGQKPFTISLLQRKALRANESAESNGYSRYSLRFTFLQSTLFAHFIDSAMKWGDNEIQIGTAIFKIEQIDTLRAGFSKASLRRYSDILERASNERQIELEFFSPTVFRSGGKRNVIFPEPQLVFGSLLTRWQAFSPVKLDDAVQSWLEHILTSRYRLATRMLDFGTYQEVGFTGQCRFELDKNVSEEIAIVLNALADFAYFCGTGAKTTMGMGQTKRIK